MLSLVARGLDINKTEQLPMKIELELYIYPIYINFEIILAPSSSEHVILYVGTVYNDC